jgi:pimeloyl-ACP methyl ester carboxylesterase
LSHFFQAEDLPAHGVGTKVWWSQQPTGQAIVFVHGFGGSALTTWSSFPSMLRTDQKFTGWDLVFFGYDGQHTEMVSSASELEALLDTMDGSPTNLYQKSTAWPGLPRPACPSAYARIVVASHSLGTVVTRRALLNGYLRSAKWASKLELLLYAPAHNGAKIYSLLMETFSVIGPFLSLAQLFNRYIVLRDLKPGSQALSDLHTDLRNVFDPTTTANLRATEVVWARNDRVVTNARLHPDNPTAPGSILSGVTHTSVCKPSAAARRPFDLLAARI